jgi:hypothetical protein
MDGNGVKKGERAEKPLYIAAAESARARKKLLESISFKVQDRIKGNGTPRFNFDPLRTFVKEKRRIGTD